jgi:hypothetical protein
MQFVIYIVVCNLFPERLKYYAAENEKVIFNRLSEVIKEFDFDFTLFTSISELIYEGEREKSIYPQTRIFLILEYKHIIKYIVFMFIKKAEMHSDEIPVVFNDYNLMSYIIKKFLDNSFQIPYIRVMTNAEEFFNAKFKQVISIKKKFKIDYADLFIYAEALDEIFKNVMDKYQFPVD